MTWRDEPERLEILCCPDCAGRLKGSATGVTCEGCEYVYPVSDGTLSLIGSRSSLNAAEVSTQDHVSSGYADVRYKRDYALRYHRSVLERMTEDLEPHGDVLDDGCGPGLLMSYLLEREGAVRRLVGVDVSTGMLRQARRALPPDDRVFLYQADACSLPFDADAFDIVYARGLLHHLPRPELGVQEIERVLKPGGTVVILEPNRNLVSALPRLLARLGPHFDADHKNFSARYLERIVSERLAIGRVSFFGYVAYVALGFPDIIDLGRFLPMDRLAPALTRLDDLLGQVPGVRRLGWGTIIVATKPARSAHASE